jgi:hypothetical protein
MMENTMSISALSSALPSLFAARPQAAAPAPVADKPHDHDADDGASAAPSSSASTSTNRGNVLNTVS